MDELDIKLAAAAKACSEDAVKRAFAAGLSVLVARGGRLVRLFSDGRESVEGRARMPSAHGTVTAARPESAPYRPGRRFRMVAGPNGSGKSTLRARLSRDYAVNFYTFLNADDVSDETQGLLLKVAVRDLPAWFALERKVAA